MYSSTPTCWYTRTIAGSQTSSSLRALDVLDRLVRSETGALSTQVLSEWFVTVTRKLKAPLNIADATERLNYLAHVWPVLALSPIIVLEAARGVRNYQFSFWDAQIWATARLNQITLVLSEDFNTGATIEGVTFANPFADNFVLADWV